MPSESMFQGLRTAGYTVPDIEKARDWYTEALGVQPYFDEPFYVGFNVAGFELALDPDGTVGEGVAAYWGVESIESEYERLLELGAEPHKPVQDVGDGIKVASVKDPFGNVFGIIFNPNFKIP